MTNLIFGGDGGGGGGGVKILSPPTPQKDI